MLILAAMLPRDEFEIRFITMFERGTWAIEAERLGVPVHVLGIPRSASPRRPSTAFAVARLQSTAARLQIAWHKNGQNPPEELAAQWTATRLIGDSLSGGSSVGEASDPAANLDGSILRTIKPQYDPTDMPSAADLDTALHNGLTAFVQAGSASRIQCVRSITARSQDAQSQPNYAVLDTTFMTVADYCADDLQSDAAAVWKNFKLASDAADGTQPKTSMTTTPLGIFNRFALKLKEYESKGILRNVDAHMSQMAVVENLASPGRVDCEIPEETIPGLHIIAANLRQVQPNV